MTDYIFEENTKFCEHLRYLLSYLDKSKHISNLYAIQLISELHKICSKEEVSIIGMSSGATHHLFTKFIQSGITDQLYKTPLTRIAVLPRCIKY